MSPDVLSSASEAVSQQVFAARIERCYSHALLGSLARGPKSSSSGHEPASRLSVMPVKFGLWRVDGIQVQQVPPAAIASEERLEEMIEARVDILGLGNLFQIGRQVITDFGKRIDLLL